MDDTQPGIAVSRLLDAAGESVQHAAGDLDARWYGLAILDPDDEPASYPDQLVLVIGARGRAATRYVRAAAERGASAVAVKPGPSGGLDELTAVAEGTGVTLLAVRPQVRWDHLEALVRDVLDGATLPTGDEDGDLYALAETTATLTGGIVSIEDVGNRVLAYSRSSDEVDELRRLSILGWQGPEQYLAMLREWGVFRQLRTSEDVVHVDDHPELGIRRRLAGGIKAGAQQLGTIWVQEGAAPLADTAETALVGAARIAAVHLLRQRGSPADRGDDLVPGLLDGTVNADLAAGRLGLDPDAPALVVAFAVPERSDDRPTHELTRTRVGNVIAVHATSYRRGALVGAVGSRTYAVLPHPPRDLADPGLRAMAREVALGMRNRAGVRLQAGIGSTVSGLADVRTSRLEADRTLDAMARTPDHTVASIAELRTEVLLGETLDLLAANPQLRVPTVQALLDHDAAHHTELARSLLAYLDALGDVRTAAGSLHVHPNTLRHRVRRAGAVTGADLDDPRERLLCHLHLVLALRE